MTLIYRNSPTSIGASTFHRHSEHLWQPCTRLSTPRIQWTCQYKRYVVPRKLSWPVESYTMRPTPTNWHRRNYMTYLMDTMVCQPQPSCRGWKGCIHNHHDLIYIRCVLGILVLWSNNSSVDIETKEETQLLKDEQTETDVGNGRTYINILLRPLII